MINLTLKPCPFCGNPAEIVDRKPPEWFPTKKCKTIRCSNAFGCPGQQIDLWFFEDSKPMEASMRDLWNTRRKKNKLTFREEQE